MFVKSKEEKAEALENFQKTILDYIENFKDAEVGPFLQTSGGAPGTKFGTDYTWSKDVHTKTYSEEVSRSIAEQAKILRNALETYYKESGENDDTKKFDVHEVQEAVGFPEIYVRNMKIASGK